MKYCFKCGTQIDDAAAFCPTCGTNQNTQQNSSVFDESKDAEDNKVYAVLSYIGLLFLVPLLAAKDSPYARFHANQGIVLFIACVVFAALCGVPFVGWLIGAIGEIGSVVLMIMGIISAWKGEKKELPFIGKFRILK